MYKNVIDIMERAKERFSDKVIFSDDIGDVTYNEFLRDCKILASKLLKREVYGKPVAVLSSRGVDCLKAMFSVVYAGGFYCVLDSEAPAERLNKIINNLSPAVLLAEKNLLNKAGELDVAAENTEIIDFDGETDKVGLEKIGSKILATDPLYVLFTSGSTGVPKGAVLTHSNVLAYSDWFINEFKIDENTYFASQTPFYFSMSVSDVFATLFTGASLYIADKSMFSFPVKLVGEMNKRKVNAIYWVPSAYQIIASLNLFKYVKPEYLKLCLFAGESMPVKHLNYWKKFLPDAEFANLFGPTETTDICTFFRVDREFADAESLPIGKPCRGAKVFLINSEGRECAVGEEGEMYVAGPFVASGYYNNEEATSAAFVQNPLNNAFPETVYRTKDVCKYNENGELIYLTRADFQIKHMGYRIEPGEIEAACVAAENVNGAVAAYDGEREEIVLFYEGKIREEDLREILKNSLPYYMQPSRIIKLKFIPHNSNGKADRKLLVKEYIG